MDLGMILLIVCGAIILLAIFFYVLTRIKGKIEIQLEKYSFSPGETINGTAVLKLKKAINAKAMEAGLIGISTSSHYGRTSTGGISQSSKSGHIFDFFYPMDGEKMYNPGEITYKFSIKIPENILSGSSSGNKAVDSLVKSAMFLTGNSRNVKWYVVSRLSIPGFDIQKKVQINIA